MIGIVVCIGFAIWTLVTLIVLATSKDIYSFFQSIGFIIVAVGWLVLVAAWPIYKHIFGEEEQW